LLEPRTFRFRTGRSSAPPAPELDRVAAALCGSSATLSGRSDPGARIRVEGGAELATAAADGEGRFAVVVPLASESVQALSLVASGAQGRASPPVGRSVRRACTAPRVERIRRDANGIEIVFSEPVDPRSLAADGAVVFTRRPEGVLPAPRADLDRTGRI